MNEGELADTLLAAKSGVDISVTGEEGLRRDELDRIVRAAGQIAGYEIYVRDESVLTPAQFRAAARKLVHRERLQDANSRLPPAHGTHRPRRHPRAPGRGVFPA